MQASRALPWVLLTAAVLVPLVMELRGAGVWRQAAAALPDYGTVPDFSLVERSGREIRRADLAGAPWVANFVFTRCSGSCPILGAQMVKLQREFGGLIRIVSFSVDPEHDTPPVLAEYAARLGASDRWLFVTGSASEVRKLVTEGFHLSASAADDGSSGEAAVTHSDRVALIDGDLRIRRYYLGTQEGWIDEIRRDIESLRVR